MPETKCLCGRIIPKEEHTGMCKLDHWISYTGNGKHGIDADELRRIIGVITKEASIAFVIDKFQELAGKNIEAEFSIGEIIDILEERKQNENNSIDR